MRSIVFLVSTFAAPPAEDVVVAKPDLFRTLVNPNCSHCVDEAKRRRSELKADDPVLCWIRGYSEGGAIPHRFFLNPYRVISDSYGVFVYDPDAGFSRGFAPSYEFEFYGWRNGVMAMRHKDGTLYSCLTGVAFDGPNKGARLKPIPTVVGEWGDWLRRYPNGVAYEMHQKYQPVELPRTTNAVSQRSRRPADPRLPAESMVLGVATAKSTRVYPLAAFAKRGFIVEEVDGEPLAVLWEPATKTAAAYRMTASQPRKWKGPEPNDKGVSPPDEGVPLPKGAPALPPRKVTLKAVESTPGVFVDQETGSRWDVAGRAVEGELKGWTLEWVDGVQVKWFAWAAERPNTTVFKAD
jgi:hypothetical protein